MNKITIDGQMYTHVLELTENKNYVGTVNLEIVIDGLRNADITVNVHELMNALQFFS